MIFENKILLITLTVITFYLCILTNYKNSDNKLQFDKIVIYTWGLNTSALIFSLKANKEGFIEYIDFVRESKLRRVAVVNIRTTNFILKTIEKTRHLWENPPKISERDKQKLIKQLYPYPDDSGITLIIKQRQKILGGLDDFDLRLIKFKKYKGYKDVEKCINLLFEIINKYGKDIEILSESKIQYYEKQREKEVRILENLRRYKE
jgi:hypothetical protein